MNVSRIWLEGFLRRPLDAQDVAARLAMLGAPVDAIEPLGADLTAFVVGHVIDVRPHPNADKLRVTTVDDGSGSTFSVVCGAPNVTAGAKYPFARLGTTMPGGLVIEKRKLRGELSEGMLCSARELGLGNDHDGLLTLDTDAAPGTPVSTVIGAGDERLVVDVTPNRADLFGHKGVARELAASYRIPFRLPEIPGLADVDIPPPVRAAESGETGGVRVVIEDRSACPRFLAGVIRGASVAPSPAWLKRAVESVGLRSINNVVDVTNYIMYELNQPMHAYDATRLRGNVIGARTSSGGETLVTLDGTTRTIPAGAAVIVDGEGVIGVAGVMGGRDSEVTDATTDILLECAAFEPSRVRKARRQLGMSTDASQRFERGTDRWGAVDAFRRAMQLLVTVAGGSIDGATVDCFPSPTYPPRIFLRPSRVAQVLGLELEWREIERCLVAIGATIVSKPGDARIAVDVPGWRPDLQAEIDLVEEIARIHGYDAIPVDVRPARPVARPDDAAWAALARMRRALAASGMSEVMTLPMVSAGDDDAVQVLNPLSAEHRFLRANLVGGLVREVEGNWAAHTRDVRLFEVGTVFTAGAPGDRPAESLHAAFAITGGRAPAHWTDAGSHAEYDIWDAKAAFERLVALAHPSAEIQVDGDGWVARRGDGRVVGRAGLTFGDAPPWAAALFIGEIELEMISATHPRFAALPAFPAASRDLTLLVDVSRPIADVVALLRQRGARAHLESATIVDEYRGPGLPENARSVTIRLVFRSTDRTLTDSEVEQATGRLLGSLERELDVTIRST